MSEPLLLLVPPADPDVITMSRAERSELFTREEVSIMIRARLGKRERQDARIARIRAEYAAEVERLTAELDAARVEHATCEERFARMELIVEAVCVDATKPRTTVQPVIKQLLDTSSADLRSLGVSGVRKQLETMWKVEAK